MAMSLMCIVARDRKVREDVWMLSPEDSTQERGAQKGDIGTEEGGTVGQILPREVAPSSTVDKPVAVCKLDDHRLGGHAVQRISAEVRRVGN